MNGLVKITRHGRPAPKYPGTGLPLAKEVSEGSERYVAMSLAVLEIITDSVVF